ncbi:alpha/beta hydrolase family protein [Actinokineospora bangkokensis]|uniref:Acetylxylan esterase n=1 Tax=Actinokineospora bangkokensis TaxID=1193682 RepID=A0A1Q9LMJ6_9PSEU|nr:acetylxylan esterase [Actinokineospora bangkokensis]OLR93241.1 acetylxylan esterase [Actinokineospora bangkokensis]
MKLRALLLATATMAAALVATTPPAQAVAPSWSAPGPYAVTVEIGLVTTVYRPARMQGRHPVIIWGNGTGGIPGVYTGLLRHLASHGFIVAAANTPMSNSGLEMLAGAAWLRAEDSRRGSAYYGHVDIEHVGAAGHSQGGAGAIVAGADPLVDTTVALEPGPLADPAKLHGPALYLAGSEDTIVNPDLLVKPLYARTTQVPAVYAELAGADHFTPLPDGGGFRGVITAWFRYNLSGDQQAAAEFTTPCGLCTSPGWTEVDRNALAGG